MFLVLVYLPGMLARIMELRHLRYFVAVAEEQNVTRAAGRLHVSQPPLSRQIRDLEDELKLELFVRTGKAVRLTEVGKVFLEEARAVLARVEQAVQAAHAVSGGMNGELHLAYAPSPTVRILPQVLTAFRQKAPSARVRLHDQSSPEMLEGLRNGKLHAALMVEPLKKESRGLVFQKLQTYPIVVAVSPAHPWSKRRSLTIAEVVDESLVAYGRKEYPDYHQMLARVLGPKVKRLRFAEECDSGTSLIAAVESGKGPAVSSASLADTAGERLRYVPLTPAPLPVVVGLAYRAELETSLARTFVETIKASFGCAR